MDSGKRIPDLFEAVLRSECQPTELEYELTYNRPYIATINDPDIINAGKNIAKQHLGDAAWIDIPEPVMASEDFSYYIKENPGAMFFLGVGEDSHGLHTPLYDFNDEALKNGISFLVKSAIHFTAPDNQLNKDQTNEVR